MMEFSRKQTTLILTGMTFFNYRQRGPTFMEVAELHGRIDMVCLDQCRSRSEQQHDYRVIFVEIKSCRADYLNDDKWTWYLEHPVVDRFEFICPEGAITLEDLNKAQHKQASKVGLRIFTPIEIEVCAKNLTIYGQREGCVFSNGKILRRSKYLEHRSETERFDYRETLMRQLLHHASWSEWAGFEKARKKTLEGIGRMLRKK